MSNRFLENQPNEICSHLTEKASKGSFLKPENGSKIRVTREKERRKRKSEEIRKGGEEKKTMFALLVFIMSYFGYSFWRKKNCWTEKVDLTITFSKIRLDIYSLKHYVITLGAKNVRGKMQRVLLTN